MGQGDLVALSTEGTLAGQLNLKCNSRSTGLSRKRYPGKIAVAEVDGTLSILGTLHSGHADGNLGRLRPGCQGHCASRVPDIQSQRAMSQEWAPQGRVPFFFFF